MGKRGRPSKKELEAKAKKETEVADDADGSEQEEQQDPPKETPPPKPKQSKLIKCKVIKGQIAVMADGAIVYHKNGAVVQLGPENFEGFAASGVVEKI